MRHTAERYNIKMVRAGHRLEVRRALYVIVTCGLVGVLVDIDHPLSVILDIGNGRFLHTPLLVVSCLVLCCTGACIGGLLIKAVLANSCKETD